MMTRLPIAAEGSSTGLVYDAGTMQVRELPSLPFPIAGQYVGALNGKIVVAGGSRWTVLPERGGKKIFDDWIDVLGPERPGWQSVAKLPRPLAYGAAVSLARSLVLAGGLDEAGSSRSVLALSGDETGFRCTAWPDLPSPLSNFSMTLAGGRIYVFGGQSASDAPARNELWSLGFDASEEPEAAWRQEVSLPGLGRILAASAGWGEDLYILGGAALSKGADGTTTRQYLREVWQFNVQGRWEQLANIPTASVAATAVCDDQGNVLLIGGDDGSMAGVKLHQAEIHPGFSRAVLRYSAMKREWELVAQMPIGLVTTGSAIWKGGRIVVPGGEDRPGGRSARVFELHWEDNEGR